MAAIADGVNDAGWRRWWNADFPFGQAAPALWLSCLLAFFRLKHQGDIRVN